MTKVFQLTMVIICTFVFMLLCDPFAQDHGSVWAKSHEILYVSVSYVIDGDSIMVKKDSQELEIRLWGIDAPEYDQKGARESKNALSSIILNYAIELEIVDQDKYGRLVAIARKDSLNVNEYMVRSGHAWVHVYYCKAVQCKKWYVFEHEARRKRLGFWRYDNQIPPWKWKANKKGS